MHTRKPTPHTFSRTQAYRRAFVRTHVQYVCVFYHTLGVQTLFEFVDSAQRGEVTYTTTHNTTDTHSHSHTSGHIPQRESVRAHARNEERTQHRLTQSLDLSRTLHVPTHTHTHINVHIHDMKMNTHVPRLLSLFCPLLPSLLSKYFKPGAPPPTSSAATPAAHARQVSGAQDSARDLCASTQRHATNPPACSNFNTCSQWQVPAIACLRSLFLRWWQHGLPDAMPPRATHSRSSTATHGRLRRERDWLACSQRRCSTG